MNNTLIISEIFYSILGESTLSGFPSIIIRLSGCNLRCRYCDTDYALDKDSGKEMSFEEIFDKIKSYSVKRILITGGEPLLQPNVILLIKMLLEKEYNILLETNGSIKLDKVPDRVVKIVDVKCPNSGSADTFLLENLKYLYFHDQIKFVISSKEDFKFALDFVRKNALKNKVDILLSPNTSKLSAKELAEWVIDSREDIYINLQIHKILMCR